MTVELTPRLDDELVRDLREPAASAGIVARATALAAALHDRNRAGRPEDDSVDFDDLFPR
ncbi:hypothetical protein ACFC26_43095 [Kitasatospora purpeofusca]|uniref:hypothetical protein n=1 Tax=Kitasatospora purpeofusca TaxID=67352 RepID=UPI0035E13BD3